MSGEKHQIEECRIHYGAPLPCEVCALQEREAEGQRRSKIMAGIRDIQIGKRYQGVTFADFKPTCDEASKVAERCRRYADTFVDRLTGGDSILLLGNPGTGKNLLAACICQQVVESGFTALHTTVMKLVRRIRDSWRRESEIDEQTAINRFIGPDLLVIDEVGVQYGSDAEKIHLFEVLNGRYEEVRPTVIISNLRLKGVEEYLGPRVIDRFFEGKSAVLEFTWESYRRGNMS